MKHLLFLLLLSFTALAQDLTIPVKVLADFKAAPEEYKGTDAYGNVYSIKDNEVRKNTGNHLLKYKNLAFGDIYKTDLQNPLQLVVFYRRFNTVVLLDNQLNEIKRINFSDVSLQQQQQPILAEAVGLASQNRLWVYDVNRQQIGLYNIPQMDFKTITPPFSDPVKYYQNDYNYFYWTDVKNRLFVVNLFGSVTALGTLPDYSQVQVLDNKQALLKTGDNLYLYNLTDNSSKRIEINEKTFSGFYYKDGILLIFTNQEIKQYNITLPN